MFRMIKSALVGIYFVFLAASGLLSQQNLVVANPGNIFDTRSSFINPAIIAFQPSQIIVGMKVFHVGFLEDDKLGFRNNYFSITSPAIFNENLIFGVNGQYFNVPLYAQSCFSFQLSHKLKNRLTLGVKYNILSHSYNKNNLDLVDPHDPVFMNGTQKIAHSFGVGLLFFPISDLSIGLSWDHINRPDVSLTGAGIRQPFMFDFGFRYTYKLISTTASLNVTDNAPGFTWMLESTFPEKGMVRFGFEMNSAKLEGQLFLVKGFSLNYSYDYPLFDLNEISSGSHQLTFIYDFDYRRTNLNRINEALITEKIEEVPEGFLVTMKPNELEIINKKFKRSFDPHITAKKLANLSAIEIGVLDSSKNDGKFYDIRTCYDKVLDKKSLNPRLVEKYDGFLQQLAQQLQQDPEKRVIIFSDERNHNRALALKDNFPEPIRKQVIIRPKRKSQKPLPPVTISDLEKETLLLFPEKTYFQVIGTKLKYRGAWKLEVTDFDGNVVRVFSGKDKIQDKIEWDWRDEQGKLLAPDKYFYTFYWEDDSGELARTEKKSFTVTKIVRHLDVEITTKQQHEINGVVKIKLDN